LRYYQNSYLVRLAGKIKFYLESRLTDGVFCISHYLVNFHLKRGVHEKKLFLVPSTVDPSRFDQVGSRPLTETYIGYFGALTFWRDNIDMLIRAFASVSVQYPGVKLVLGGFCNKKERKQILELIDELKIQPKILLLEYLTRQEIARYIFHTDILVMVRLRDFQSDASYPSKLAEYLATGNPVISVKVGEVADFLKDGINAFLVEPGNVNELAEKIIFILNNPDIARKVGRNGKEITDTVFHYRHQAKRMLGFIASLSGSSGK
jgi:glycosyltransferase involved in cell wall biosynthesis